MQQVVKAVDEQGRQGSKEHLYRDPERPGRYVSIMHLFAATIVHYQPVPSLHTWGQIYKNILRFIVGLSQVYRKIDL